MGRELVCGFISGHILVKIVPGSRSTLEIACSLKGCGSYKITRYFH